MITTSINVLLKTSVHPNLDRRRLFSFGKRSLPFLPSMPPLVTKPLVMMDVIYSMD